MISARRKWPSESYPLRPPPPRKIRSRKRSSPPVLRRLVNSSERLPANGLAALPSFCSWASSGWVDAIAGPEVRAVRPRLVKNVVELFANAGRFVKASLIPGAAAWRSVNTGGRLFGELAEAFGRRSELAQERREVGEVLGERAAVLGGGA